MFVAWRDLRFARGRFALIGGVVVLITMLVGLLSGLTAGLGRESTSAVTGLSADRLVLSERAESFADSSFTATDWDQWDTQPGVLDAEPIGISPSRASVGDRSTSVTVFGVEPGSDVSGLASTVSAGNVVLSEPAAHDLGVVSGGRLTVGGLDLVVRAVEGQAWFSHTPVVWVALSDWQRLQDETTEAATGVALRTDGSFDVAEASAPGEVRSVDESLSAIGSYTAENGSLQLIRGFLFVISAVVVGAFFTVWTIQRSADVAVLKALGASDGYLTRDALGQALVLLVGGGALGTGLAVAAGRLAQGTVPFVLDPATIGLPVLAMVVLGLLGAALSVRRITSVDPLTALGSVR